MEDHFAVGAQPVKVRRVLELGRVVTGNGDARHGVNSRLGNRAEARLRFRDVLSVVPRVATGVAAYYD